MNKKTQTRNIVSFYDLPEKWQAEAIKNLDENATENHYLEPEADKNPKEHILWDLSEAIKSEGTHKGFKYNASMGISNNSAMLLKIDADFESAEILFV